MKRHKKTVLMIAVVFVALLLPDAAFAGGGGGPAMPWDGPLQAFLDALTGQTMGILAGFAFLGAGLVWAFTEHERGVKRFAQGIVGVSIGIGAVQLADVVTGGLSGAIM